MCKYFNFQVYILFKLLLCLSFTADGMDLSHHRFKHITSEDGLSANRAEYILKSSNGYYWFGTSNGLNRYDGYDIKVYKHDKNNKNSLSNDFITGLVEDNDGNIWIATGKGLNKLSATTEKFTHHFANNTNGSLNHNVVYSLLFDNNQLWIGTRNGLNLLNIMTNNIVNKFTGVTIFDIIGDNEHLWFASNIGLLKFNKKTNKITNFYGLANPKQIIKIIRNNNTLWIPTLNGLLPFNLSDQKFENDKILLPNIAISRVISDESNNLWIATTQSGLYHFSNKRNKIQKIESNIGNLFQLQSNAITTLMIDNNDFWIGSNAGISYTTLKNPIKYLRSENNDIIYNNVYDIEQNSLNSLWISTERGISKYSKTGSEHYKADGITKILTNSSPILALAWEKLYKYNHEKNIFSTIAEPIGQEIAPPLFSYVEKLSEKQLILATERNLFIWNQMTNESYILEFPNNSKVNSVNYVKIIRAYGNIILLGAYPGLFFIKKNNPMLMTRYLLSKKPTLLDNSVVSDITVDANGFLWIATWNGLFKVKDRNIIKHYTLQDGLPGSQILSVIHVENIIWVNSIKGLASFKIADNNFEKIHLNNEQFDIEFNPNAAHIGNDGLLYFGTNQGVMYFNPKNFTESTPPPKTTITNFHLFNKPVQPGTELLPKTIEYTKHLTLNHNQNMLTFEFSSMNIRQPNHLYAYQLKGLDHQDDWLITDAKNRRATFTPSPGEYTFKVKSGWDKNTWSDKIAEVKITILPPWWQTTWAYATYLTLLLLSIFTFIRIRTVALAKRAKQLENTVNERTEQLRISNTELQQSHKKIEHLLERKNILFANTSHELRTPLTLILGPINDALKSSTTQQKQSLELAKRNTERLVHMVDQLLELSRMSSPSKDDFIEISFSKVLNLTIHSLQSTLQENSIHLHHDIEDNIYIAALPDALDILALNLISNAIKYTPKNGKINIGLCKKDTKAIFRVKDNGIGIAPADQARIFEQFTRLDEARTHNIPGSGIGLALVKELLQLHEGNIELNSTVGQGSEFTITLPLSTGQRQTAQTDTISEKHSANILPYRHDPSIQNTKQENKPSSTKPNLLIVDDTEDMLSYLYQLTSSQYNCTTVNNGKDALKHAETYSVDLIISDVMMPGMDGFEVLQQLRENIQTCHIPVILLTAKGDKFSRIKGYEAQVDDYIAKPFDAEELLARIENLINNRRLLRQDFSKKIHQGELLTDDESANLVKKDKEFLRTFQILVQENYHDDTYRVSDIATAMFMSERALLSKLKTITEHTPSAYLSNYRLQKACGYLQDSSLSVQNIAERVGFSESGYFSRIFKKHYGKTPKQYRESFSD